LQSRRRKIKITEGGVIDEAVESTKTDAPDRRIELRSPA
jgi:hypothetical protein